MKTRRSGTSLIEVVVVLTIVVIVSAMSIPSIQAMYGSYKLNGAVDSVRSAWADARARAIEEGRPYRFAVEPDGSAYRVAPDDSAYWEGASAAPDHDPNGPGMILEKSLPAGVRFTVNGEAGSSTSDEPTKETLDEKPVTSANWSSAVVFLPDGTTREDVTIAFQVRGCKPTTLQLRSLTGNVSVDH